MAHLSPDSDKKKTDTREEQNEVTTPTSLLKIDGLSLKSKSTDSGQESLDEACGGGCRASSKEETSLKSLNPQDMLTKASFLSQECTCIENRGNDIDRREAHKKQGIMSESFVPEGGTHHQNISQNASPSVGSGDAEHSLASCKFNIKSSSCDSSANESPGQINQYEMNILTSLQSSRVKNTEIPAAFAEQQPSFRTLQTIKSDLPPINRDVGVQLHQQFCPDRKPPVPQSSFHPYPSSLGQYYHPVPLCSGGYVTSEENMPNNPVFKHCGHLTSAQPVNQALFLQHNGVFYGGGSGGASGGGQQLSHSSSSNSMRSFIGDDCRVNRMSWRILRHVALNLQCKGSTITWKDLVEMYGWDYQRTNLFESRRHEDYLFLSLLQEPEFQDYTLQQLREDLFHLPRKDILSDLNDMIREHNAAANSRHGLNQL